MKFEKFVAAILLACVAVSTLAAEALDANMDIAYAMSQNDIDIVDATLHQEIGRVNEDPNSPNFYEKEYVPSTEAERYYGSLGFDHSVQTLVFIIPDFTFADIVIAELEPVQPVVHQSSLETLQSLFQHDISDRFLSTAPPVLA